MSTPLKLYCDSDQLEGGVDEAGRGCLMGRVYAAAVVLPQEFPDEYYLQIKDSKKLSAKKRYQLQEYIQAVAISYGVGFASPAEIDQHNIFNANQMAMHRAIDNLSVIVDSLLVDGNHFKPYFDKEGNFTSYQCVVKGDNTYMSIAAAGILAKCAHDTYIKELLVAHPEWEMYGWESNMGYGTADHLHAIRCYGTTSEHRKTFGICKTY